MSNILSDVKVIPGYLLCQKVNYGQKQLLDPDSTSDIWFKVIRSNDANLPEGTLVRFQMRMAMEENIDGTILYSVKSDIVMCYIQKENVKENLLR